MALVRGPRGHTIEGPPSRSRDCTISTLSRQQASDHGPAHEARKLVTVVFADLVGSTQLGEQLDTEDLRALLTDFFGAMAEVIEEWGGSVDRFIGDAIVAIFGIPKVREDDAVRAVHAGLAMQERLTEVNVLLKERYGVAPAMRIGVNTGEVIASLDADAILAGDVFNVASRLQDLAEPGTVIAGERTHRAAESSFEFVPLGEVRLKGKSLPETPYVVAGTSSAGRVPGFETEMVGRTAELGMLQALMDQAVGGGTPRLVVVVGEAGIGKSRLVREFVATNPSEARILYGRCLPYGHGITFWPLREILWESGGITFDDTPEAAVSKLESLVHSLPKDSVADPDWLAFALATTAGITVPDNPFDQLSPESAGEELQIAWPIFATALATEVPTVVVVEDVHWGEAPLLDMIEQLAVRAIGPLLLIATARPVFIRENSGWGARAIPSQISLGPLAPTSFDQLITALLPDLDDTERHRLLDSAGGNPFFAEEIARYARDEGVARSGHRLGVVPDTARAILAARLELLDAADREILQDASVIGEVFWPAPLEEMGHPNASSSLAVLERGGFITTRPTTTLPGEREFVFRHGLMRDVVYQSIPKRRLGAIHASVAEWTEALAATRRDEFIEVIAHHYDAAAQPEIATLAWRDDAARGEQMRARAVAALIDAGKAARHRFSIDQAVEYADRALVLARTGRERLESLELKAASYDAAARVDDGWPVHLEAISAARTVGDEDDISRVHTDATLMWARYSGAFRTDEWKPVALSVVKNRLAEIGEEEDSLELAALLIGRSVWGRREMLERTTDEVKADAERAVAVSERLGSKRLLAYSLDAYEMVLREEGYCQLGDLADRMVQLGSDMPDRRDAHEMLVTSAISLTEIGRYKDSRAVGGIAYKDAHVMGVHQRIHGIRALTGYMVPMGLFAETLEGSEGLLELIDEDGGRVCDFGGGAVVGRALALFERDRSEEGLRAVEFFEGALPDTIRVPIVELQLIERVRPFVDSDHVGRLFANVQGLTAPVHRVYRVRARLPLVVLEGDWPAAEELIAEARSLAEPCCAPEMLSLADWAEAVRDGSVSDAQKALATLREPYTAARLAVDFLGTIPIGDGSDFRAVTKDSLEAMGATASLSELGSG